MKNMNFQNMMMSLIQPLRKSLATTCKIQNSLKPLSLFLFLPMMMACATTETLSSGLQVITQSEYENILATNTDTAQVYDGLYNTLEVSGTLLSNKIVAAQNSQSARLYLWDKAKFESENAKASEKMSKETEIFVSFYTPEKKHDDLAKNKTLWKIFLDVDGQRYEGKATKLKLLLTEVQGLYPYHNRFSTPYILSFPVASKTLDGKGAKLILTGAVGSVSLNFINKN